MALRAFARHVSSIASRFLCCLIIGAIAMSSDSVFAQSTATLTWSGTTSGSQDMTASPTLVFTPPGTYTLTVSTSMSVTFEGAAGGHEGYAGGNGIDTGDDGGSGVEIRT